MSPVLTTLLVLALIVAYREHRVVLGVLAAAILVGATVDHERGPTGTMLTYREAHLAVARATGRPCDYHCKEVIADLSRQ